MHNASLDGGLRIGCIDGFWKSLEPVNDREHGQRTAIEVMELSDGRYGLISGWRRLAALERLSNEAAGDDKFCTVLALLRQPENASDAYVSMVEENEIRVGLSYYERARVVALVVGQGVFPSEKVALAKLFAAGSRANRSKIGSFLRLFHALDDVLRFPTHLGERQGLALAKGLDGSLDGVETTLGALRARLTAAEPATPEVEWATLQEALSAGQGAAVPDPVAKPAERSAEKPTPPKAGAPAELRPGVFLANEGGYLKRRVVLTGPKVDEAFQKHLEKWLREAE